MTGTGIKRHQAGRNHYYSLDGLRVDGVTTLIGDGLPKKAIAPWAAKKVAEYVADATDDFLWQLRQGGRDAMVGFLKGIPWETRNKAAVRGTEIHSYAEALVSGAAVDVPEELTGYVESLVAFMDEWKPTPLLTETVVASRTWQYAGTLDLIADFPDGRRVLLDYKTSASGIWPETALQLAAYRYADCYLGDDGTEMPMTEIGIDECWAVWIRADGYDVKPLAADKSTFQTFLHIAQVARSASFMRGWVGPSMESPFKAAAA